MTTFSYRLTLGDGEAISARAALTHYIEFCEKKQEEGIFRLLSFLLANKFDKGIYLPWYYWIHVDGNF